MPIEDGSVMSSRREEAVSRAMGNTGARAGLELADPIEESAPARGVDIEIIEKNSAGRSDTQVVVPNSVKINDREVLIPEGSTIRIGDVTFEDAVTVTLTMFVASLSIKGE